MLAAIPFPEIDPEIFRIGPFALRWYAVAYIAGLVLGWRYVALMMRRERLWPGGRPPMAPARTDDLLFWMTIGVVIGGRLGYVLFYQPQMLWTFSPQSGLPQFLEIWEGGMSFHGGFLGVVVGLILFARSIQAPLLSLGDAVACAAPIGLLFGRIANFINGELWGRVTDQPWGMVFPQVEAAARQYPWLVETIGQPRHPSQLYEAALEGALLFALLALLAWRSDALKRPGLCVGAFLVGYGLARGFVEFFRQWDPYLEFDAVIFGVGVTRGQTLCIPMVIAGAAIACLAWRRGRRTVTA